MQDKHGTKQNRNKKNGSGTEIGNFEEIRFRRPTPARLSRVVKADLSAY